MFIFKRKTITVDAMTPQQVHERARAMVNTTIDELRDRSDWLEASIAAMSAELAANEETLGALVDARASYSTTLTDQDVFTPEVAAKYEALPVGMFTATIVDELTAERAIRAIRKQEASQ